MENEQLAVINIVATKNVMDAHEQAAKQQGQSLGMWCREQLNKAAGVQEDARLLEPG